MIKRKCFALKDIILNVRKPSKFAKKVSMDVTDIRIFVVDMKEFVEDSIRVVLNKEQNVKRKVNSVLNQVQNASSKATDVASMREDVPRLSNYAMTQCISLKVLTVRILAREVYVVHVSGSRPWKLH